MTGELVSRLPQLLQARNMMPVELAEAAGVDIGAVNALLVGRLPTDGASGIHWNTLWRICRALGCKPGEVVDLEEPRFAGFVKEVGGACTLVTGSNLYLALDPGTAVGAEVVVTAERRHRAVEDWDARAQATILRQGVMARANGEEDAVYAHTGHASAASRSQCPAAPAWPPH